MLKWTKSYEGAPGGMCIQVSIGQESSEYALCCMWVSELHVSLRAGYNVKDLDHDSIS